MVRFCGLSFACLPAAFLIVCAFTPFTPLAQSQSSDDVHIIPREHAEDAKPVRASMPIESSAERFRVNVDLVMVPVSVTDAANRFVPGLRKESFSLFEGGQQQQIRHFSMEDAPISVGVLLDLSKSMTNKIDDAREALSEFFKTANPQDDYFVITFADRPEMLADAGQSVGMIQGKLATATPGGHTALLDAIYMGIHHMRTARYSRRALLIISDGGDNRSRYRPSEIRRLVQEADVQIYAIGIFDTIFKTPEEWAGKKLLTDITDATGGRTITLSNAARLPSIAAQISLELRNQYVLGYRPTNPVRDAKWRKISVRLNATESPSSEPLQLHFRRGYAGSPD
jgi:Ca-activated chloride channel family protein